MRALLVALIVGASAVASGCGSSAPAAPIGPPPSKAEAPTKGALPPPAPPPPVRPKG